MSRLSRLNCRKKSRPSGSVDVLSPAGGLLASYPLDGGRVTNLAWWEGELYVTVSGSHRIDRLDVFTSPALPAGKQPRPKPHR